MRGACSGLGAATWYERWDLEEQCSQIMVVEACRATSCSTRLQKYLRYSHVEPALDVRTVQTAHVTTRLTFPIHLHLRCSPRRYEVSSQSPLTPSPNKQHGHQRARLSLPGVHERTSKGIGNDGYWMPSGTVPGVSGPRAKCTFKSHRPLSSLCRDTDTGATFLLPLVVYCM